METFRFVLPFARPYWRSFALGLLLVPPSITAALMIPWLTGECVDVLRRSHATDASAAGTPAPGVLSGYILVILALAVTRGVTLFAVRWLIISASRHTELALRNRLFGHLQTLDQTYFHRVRTGDILSRLTSDVEHVRTLVGPIILYSASTLCMLAAAVPMMVSVSVPLTLLIMVPLTLLTVAVRKIGPRVHAEVFRAQETLADLSSHAQEDFSGIRVVKAFAQEEAETARFRDIAQRYLEQNVRAARIASWMQPIVGGVGDLALLVLLAAGGYSILAGSIDLGDFIKFTGCQAQLIWPMISIGWVVNQFHRARASVDRLRQLLAAESRVRDPEPARMRRPQTISGNVSIRGLTMELGGRRVLDGVSMDAPAGSFIAVVGRVGAGKSTVVSTLPRIVQPPPGTVFLDGVDVNDLPLSILRRSISYVPQDSFLFSRTIHENIAFGVDGASRTDVERAAAIARFDKDIEQFPHGFDEVVGERGVTLSGGQRQRAALARALLVEAPVLILDDPFSAVDVETEKEILHGMRDAARDRTTIVVAHRISTVLHADRIYVLDQGRVVEAGRHEDLVARRGIYAELYRLQLLSDELERL